MEGWRFIKDTPVVRGLVIGMLGAFCAAGVVIGLASSYIQYTLNGGAGFSLVFAVILIGLAIGMGFGSRPFGDFSRRRLFGVTLTASAVPFALIALVPNLVVVTVLVFLVGVISGTAYPTGFTIVGLEVDDDTRGRVFAFFQSTIQAILLAVIAVAGFIATGFSAAIQALAGSSNGLADREPHLRRPRRQPAAAAVGGARRVRRHPVLPATRRPQGRAAVPGPVGGGPQRAAQAPADRAAARRAAAHGPAGLFIAFEGGEGVGKTTQARLIAIWLREQGYDVVTTHEPGATKIGMRLRALLLDTAHVGMSPHGEALLYAADRAEHVAKVIDPALERGAVVITDRYIDSSLAYQGAGRGQATADIARLNSWATDGREPDLTILLDMEPAEGLSRRARSADRLEAEPLDFHRRVQAGFLELARAKPDQYLVVDAAAPPDEITEQIKDQIREVLPDPVPRTTEAVTGSFAGHPRPRFPASSRSAGESGPGPGDSVFDELAGQEAVVAQLRNAVAGAMTHAWLFTGPPGSGRSVAARAFAAALLCPFGGCGECPSCRQVRAGTHADLLLVRPDGLSYGVKQTRDLVLRAAGAPSGGRWRVVLFEDADRCTEAAANALLKAIEEPAPRTVWLLCSPSAEDLVTTIRSRCRVMTLRVPPSEAVASVLAERDGIDYERALACRPGRAGAHRPGAAARDSTRPPPRGARRCCACRSSRSHSARPSRRRPRWSRPPRTRPRR